MRHFTIFVDGAPPVEVANKFWVEITRYNVNFLILGNESYIYGQAKDKVIEELLEKTKSFGFALELERGAEV